MLKAFRISFALKNTYRVNSILYSLKQIPLVKHLLPDALYKSRGLKIFGNVLSGIWEVLSAFIGKALYLFLMVAGIGVLYEQAPADGVFLHILFFLKMCIRDRGRAAVRPARRGTAFTLSRKVR